VTLDMMVMTLDNTCYIVIDLILSIRSMYIVAIELFMIMYFL